MSAPFPHCNSKTLHAPGECYYCDQYPNRQRVRAICGEPFSPNEANGWSGNVAVKKGEVHSHMGFPYIVGMKGPEVVFIDDPVQSFDDALAVLAEGSEPCQVRFKRTWRCTRREHTGPCALLPKWWNLVGRWRSP